MYLPTEIYARIAEEIRAWDDRLVEEKTLVNLSAVSKSWRPEALRALWSKVVIDDKDKGSMNPRGTKGTIAMVSIIFQKEYCHYIRDLRIILEMANATEEPQYVVPGFSMEDKIIYILYNSHNLRALQIRDMAMHYSRKDENVGSMIIQSAYRCRFHQLRRLKLMLNQNDDYREPDCSKSGDALLRFLSNHPELTHLELSAENEYSLEPGGRFSRLLSNLKCFKGSPEEASILAGSSSALGSSLTDITLDIDPMDADDYDHAHWCLVRDLGLLDKPFNSVRSLVFTADCGPYLDVPMLLAIHRCFPNVDDLRGVAISPYLVNILLAETRIPNENPLPKLNSLKFDGYEIEGMHDNEWEVEEALGNLPCLFESLRTAFRSVDYMSLSRNRRPDRLHLTFDENGSVKTRERERHLDWQKRKRASSVQTDKSED
ncbi:hypothetical protein SISNIDRAFT_450171, partial [Sistotremastrum niveocremeum HHB9708]